MARTKLLMWDHGLPRASNDLETFAKMFLTNVTLGDNSSSFNKQLIDHPIAALMLEYLLEHTSSITTYINQM